MGKNNMTVIQSLADLPSKLAIGQLRLVCDYCDELMEIPGKSAAEELEKLEQIDGILAQVCEEISEKLKIGP